MYTYDIKGNMVWETNTQKAQELLILSLASATSYTLSPDAVGKLHELLGPTTPDLTRARAEEKIKTVLNALGIDAPIEAIVETLDREWQLILGIGPLT